MGLFFDNTTAAARWWWRTACRFHTEGASDMSVPELE